MELSFVPAEVSSLDTIYENLSYCASLHQDDMDDEYMDGDEDYYEDDVNDHEGLYADADIQGGYIPKSNSATAIGTSTSATSAGAKTEEMEQVPAIDLQSGEWYTGNAETDAKFELSEQGQVMVQQWSQNQKQDTSAVQGKRARQDGEDEDEEEGSMAVDGAAQEYTEEQEQEARSKMWRAY